MKKYEYRKETETRRGVVWTKHMIYEDGRSFCEVHGIRDQSERAERIIRALQKLDAERRVKS